MGNRSDFYKNSPAQVQKIIDDHEDYHKSKFVRDMFKNFYYASKGSDKWAKWIAEEEAKANTLPLSLLKQLYYTECIKTLKVYN